MNAQPRVPLPSRPLMLKVHRWLSLGALVWLVVISLTGSILVFAPQIEEWSRPELFRATAGDKGPQSAVDAALAHFEGQDTALDDIGMPADNRGVYLLTVEVTPPRAAEELASGEVGEVRDPSSWLVYVDPGTGEVNGAKREASGFIFWAKRGHYLLWQDGGFLWVEGDDLAGLVALATFFVTLTGLYIWWFPRVKHWFRNLRVRRRRGWFIFNLDLHRTLGMAVLLPLAVISFTGAAFAFPDMKLIWQRVTPAQHDYEQHEPDEELLSEEVEDAKALTTDSVTALLRKRYPTLTLESLEPPYASDDVWAAWLTKGYSPWQRDGSGGNFYVQLDRFSHEVLYAGTPEDGNVWDQAWDDWSLPLHGGDFLGNFSRSIWLVVGVTPLVLSGTGAAVWLNRRKRRQAAAGAAAAGEPPSPPDLEQVADLTLLEPVGAAVKGDRELVAEPARRAFTSGEYARMAEAGVLRADERLELLNGEIVRKPATRAQHAECVDRLTKLFVTRAADRARVRVQGPVRLGDVSEAEPDVALVRPGHYATSHPDAADTLLIVEVTGAGSYDRRIKLPLYALSRVPEVWVVDPAAGLVEVYAGPQLSGWTTKARLHPGATVSPAALTGTAFTVDELLGL